MTVNPPPYSLLPQPCYNYPMDTDVYFHKVVEFRGWKQELLFRTSQSLFSSHDIDIGTRFLLRTIVEAAYSPPQKILDLGCGYGPLGLTLKALHPQSAVRLTDRDALAVDYARQNAGLNGLEGVEAYGSLGYDDVKENDFGLIVTNIPGKAGEPVITYLLREAQYYLKPGGIAAIVIVSPLAENAAKILAETPGAEVILKRERPGHTVFHYRFTGEQTPPRPAQTAFERGIYHRKDVTIKYGDLQYNMRTAYGLPEFDSLSYDTEILFKALKGFKNKEFRRVAVFNPGQGHVPAALWQYFHPQAISLIDRDLLALRCSSLNLVLNGCPAESITLFHKTGLDIENQDKFDLIAGVLPDENKEALQLTLERAAGRLVPGGMVLLSGSSTAVTRLVTYIEANKFFTIKSRERWRGYSALVLERV
jgi:16S rRNA (guanine1207-N2)-methyltransferase